MLSFLPLLRIRASMSIRKQALRLVLGVGILGRRTQAFRLILPPEISVRLMGVLFSSLAIHALLGVLDFIPNRPTRH